MYVVTSMLGLASMLEVLPLTRRVSRSRLLKGGATVNTTLCRTHELKSGDRRRPETERQGLTPRPSHDSRVASREFVTHRVRYTGTARPNPIIGTPGVITCASSLRCELHSRLQSPQVTTEDCPKTLLRDTTVMRALREGLGEELPSLQGRYETGYGLSDRFPIEQGLGQGCLLSPSRSKLML